MKIEPLTEAMLKGLEQALTPVQRVIINLHDVDISKGRGVLDNTGRKHCMWTKKGKRITVDANYGLFVSESKDVDSNMPK